MQLMQRAAEASGGAVSWEIIPPRELTGAWLPGFTVCEYSWSFTPKHTLLMLMPYKFYEFLIAAQHPEFGRTVLRVVGLS